MASKQRACVVWDGGDSIYIPESMGAPREDQLVGTVYERLGELAGRICYDSLGTGRPSCNAIKDGKPVEGYHDHIHATRNYSVMEHGAFTLRIAIPGAYSMTEALASLLNRPTLHAAVCMPGLSGQRELRLTLNARHVIDWRDCAARNENRIHNASAPIGAAITRSVIGECIGDTILHAANKLAPYFFKGLAGVKAPLDYYFAPPSTNDERWVSMYLRGSRGFTHEQVRHGDWSAISQRSTRYVDESGSDWCVHPLIEQYWKEHESAGGERDTAIVEQSRSYYSNAVAALEPWLIARGVDKATARKQARGAARGYLGNALESEMIFSASVSQWRWMIHERLSPFADAEIREVYSEVLPALKESRYGDYFGDMRMVDSPDGIGKVLQMNGPREEWRHRI